MGDHISDIYANTHQQTGPFLLVSLFTGVDLSCPLPLTGAPYLFNTVWVGLCVCGKDCYQALAGLKKIFVCHKDLFN